MLRCTVSKISKFEITGYRIKYSRVFWLLELQIERVRKVWTQLHTVKGNSRTSNYQCGLFKKKNRIIRIFCISGWLLFLIILNKWSSTVEFNIVARLLRRRIERKSEYVLLEDLFGFRRAKGTSDVVGKLGIL